MGVWPHSLNGNHALMPLSVQPLGRGYSPQRVKQLSGPDYSHRGQRGHGGCLLLASDVLCEVYRAGGCLLLASDVLCEVYRAGGCLLLASDVLCEVWIGCLRCTDELSRSRVVVAIFAVPGNNIEHLKITMGYGLVVAIGCYILKNGMFSFLRNTDAIEAASTSLIWPAPFNNHLACSF